MEDKAVKAEIQAFFDEATFTVSYLVSDPETRRAAIIDSVLDFDPKSGRTSTASAERVLAAAKAADLTIDWILETHAHADHLSAAPFLKARTGARIAIGEHIRDVQKVFRPIFHAEDVTGDGRQFDRLFADGEHFTIGNLDVEVLHTPGHTPACVSYKVGSDVFVGDTLFMPDYGTARADFPGGDARTLYRSIARLLALPPETTLWMCHDYKAPGRDSYAWKTTVAEERAHNVHVHDGVGEDEFVAMRQARDKTLAMPVLILPSVQVNMRAGQMPPAEDDGKVYLKLPVNRI
jgi:glyoxylase-like metal-dependent hydrolase (beta-lactamase superfamily II)